VDEIRKDKEETEIRKDKEDEIRKDKEETDECHKHIDANEKAITLRLGTPSHEPTPATFMPALSIYLSIYLYSHIHARSIIYQRYTNWVS
jgi:hypothetical protein